jgi:hypothetical protein
MTNEDEVSAGPSFRFVKASGQHVQGVHIHIDQVFEDLSPQWGTIGGMSLEEAGRLYEQQAVTLGNLLKAALPCGTLDRLLVQLLQAKLTLLKPSFIALTKRPTKRIITPHANKKTRSKKLRKS